MSVYVYDGSFDGFLSAVFESYRLREVPTDIISEESEKLTLCPAREILTDRKLAARVRAGLRKKVCDEAEELVRLSFLTCLEEKEMKIYAFIRIALREGAVYMRRLHDETLHKLNSAVQHMRMEAHLFTGFLRFSEHEGALVATVNPKNDIMTLIAPHFTDRFSNETFIIYDSVHKKALFYNKGRSRIVELDSFTMPGADKKENEYRELWKGFFKTITIEGRENPLCQRTHLPLRYRTYMTEFIDGNVGNKSIESLPAGSME